MNSDFAVATLGLIAFLAWGAAVWFGWYRRWAYSPYPTRIGNLIAPWGAAALLVMLLSSAIKAVLGVPQADAIVWVVQYVAGGCAIIGTAAAALQWPPWALPPWYRQWRMTGKAQHQGDALPSRDD